MTPEKRRDLIDWSAAEAERLRCADILGSGVISRLRSGLGGSHTVVTYPPLDALEPVSYKEVIKEIGPVDRLSLYLHIAFCEYLCPFCHYDTAHSKIGAEESEGIRSYLGALHTELANWKLLISGSTLGSLYVGGGTPTAVSTERLLALLESVHSIPRAPGATTCVETSPLTTVAPDGRSKLEALVRAGVDRFSIGVQSFNSDLLRRSRGHTREVVIDALDILLGLLDNVNIDLIQDLPGQTAEHIVEDLVQVERFKPAQVTWYILRLRDEAAWFRRYARAALELPAPVESLRKTLLIREGMARLGYIAMPGGRFVREEKFRDQFKDVRSGLNSTLLGLGVSAYSHGWEMMFRNTYSRQDFNGIRSYVERVNSVGYGIETGLRIDEVERAASTLVAGIRSGVELPAPTPATEHYITYATALLGELEAAGLVARDSRGLHSMTRLGSLFEEEVCALLYSTEVRRRLAGQRPTGKRPSLNPHGAGTGDPPMLAGIH
jgi:coproporphyrinogen III oxidase-like Fe-S oxidoreductase